MLANTVRKKIAVENLTDQDRREMAIACNQMGALNFNELREKSDGLGNYYEAIQYRKDIANPTEQDRKSLVQDCIALGFLYKNQENPNRVEAPKGFKDALEYAVNTINTINPTIDEKRQRVQGYICLASIYYMQGKWEEARKHYEEGVGNQRVILNELSTDNDNYLLASYLIDLGNVYQKLCLFDKAKETYKRAINSILSLSSQTAESYKQLSTGYRNIVNSCSYDAKEEVFYTAACAILSDPNLQPGEGVRRLTEVKEVLLSRNNFRADLLWEFPTFINYVLNNSSLLPSVQLKNAFENTPQNVNVRKILVGLAEQVEAGDTFIARASSGKEFQNGLIRKFREQQQRIFALKAKIDQAKSEEQQETVRSPVVFARESLEEAGGAVTQDSTVTFLYEHHNKRRKQEQAQEQEDKKDVSHNNPFK